MKNLEHWFNSIIVAIAIVVIISMVYSIWNMFSLGPIIIMSVFSLSLIIRTCIKIKLNE